MTTPATHQTAEALEATAAALRQQADDLVRQAKLLRAGEGIDAATPAAPSLAPATPTLGAMLAKQQADERANNAAAMKLRTQQEGEAEQARVTQLEKFFEGFKQDVITSIQQGRKLPAYLIGQQWGKPGSNLDVEKSLMLCSQTNLQALPQNSNWRVLNSKHKYAPLWQKLDAWAKSEGLLVHLRYEWDGGGMTSWHVLTVAPL